jgi:hypothetical protein
VRPLVVVPVDELINACLRLEHVDRGGARGVGLEREAEPLMSAVLLGMPGGAPLEADAETLPPHRELAEAIRRRPTR